MVIRIRVWNGNVENSILQWGCSFESGSNCSDSMLCEHTDTSCNAKIVNSIIAPNTGVLRRMQFITCWTIHLIPSQQCFD